VSDSEFCHPPDFEVIEQTGNYFSEIIFTFINESTSVCRATSIWKMQWIGRFENYLSI